MPAEGLQACRAFRCLVPRNGGGTKDTALPIGLVKSRGWPEVEGLTGPHGAIASRLCSTVTRLGKLSQRELRESPMQGIWNPWAIT